MGKRFDTLLFPGNRKKAFTLSFDDGVVQDRRFLQILDRYGVKCTFNLGYGVLGYHSPEGMPFDISKVEKEEVRELYRNHEVGGHGLYHSDLASVKTPVAMYEIIEDKAQLEKLTGYPLRMFAYPFGTFNQKTKKLLKNAGYFGARTVRSTHSFDLPKDPFELDPTCHYNDDKLMELAKDLTEKQTLRPELFYVWGHAYEFDQFDNWERIEELVSYMSQFKDSVWFATNGEILQYLRAYDMLEYSADGSMIYNPSATDIDIMTAFGMTEHLKAGTLTQIRETPL